MKIRRCMRLLRGGFRGNSRRSSTPFWEKNMANYLGNNWSMTGAVPLLDNQPPFFGKDVGIRNCYTLRHRQNDMKVNNYSPAYDLQQWTYRIVIYKRLHVTNNRHICKTIVKREILRPDVWFKCLYFPY